jgi:hypothetical protein
MNKPHLQCFLEEVLILVHLGVSPAGSGEYQGRRKCFSFLVHQEGDTLGSVLSRDLKIHIKPSHVSLVKLSISTSSTLHCHTLSPPPPSTCYLILDLCSYCSCLRATSLPSRTYSRFSFSFPDFSRINILGLYSFHSLLGSILSLSCILSLRKHSRLYCHPALRNTKHHLHKSDM